ncbi:hypothetical protein I3842_07G153100 [Carya illinoinensis]|uniref:Snakin-2 n=1 Tax=Carya illinoinensis TaxID=32201 RepID=A0A922EJG5_CARIL|nr:hypothetical protein I3842_07G153100 [Carya illinoinensis]
MSISKTSVTSVLIYLLLIHLNEAYQMVNTNVAKDSLPKQIDCGAAYTARCQLSSRQRMCKRACGTCCARCNYVPPGTSGNQEVCPCYANMTTHANRRKCP